ncbi:MAG: tRNA lysidine(34) synthetase TilS [Oscillospiraceae bacterium]|nr:tRNA lysidine(34) synthetase TilS [Oscillospiraceae bacterium]
MLNDLLRQLRSYDMVQPGDTVFVAVSGGADSMALLWSMYLLREKLGIVLKAAHFNHHLRGEESDGDEAFVREFCDRWEIPLSVSGGEIQPGKKGLEAAAREARYAFLRSLPGKVATAHTADDNAETLLMHLIRGTGLKGLGGISPMNGTVIRPMLGITRQQVMEFLEENHIPHVEDSSNAGDRFLRNRLRHDIMPLLVKENPRLAENLSATAQRLRQDEAALAALSQFEELPTVSALKEISPALRSRMLEQFLRQCGVPEPEASHIALAERLVFSSNPSATAQFPGNVTLCRNYDRLVNAPQTAALPQIPLPECGTVQLPKLGLRVTCSPATEIINTADTFTVCPEGQLFLRSRQSGDEIRLSGGTKSLKKLFIDRKIPAADRQQIPILCDRKGILGVYRIGNHLDRTADTLPAVTVRFEPLQHDI